VYDTDSTVVVVLELLNEVCTDHFKSFISIVRPNSIAL